jgi:hypothetical protein
MRYLVCGNGAPWRSHGGRVANTRPIAALALVVACGGCTGLIEATGTGSGANGDPSRPGSGGASTGGTSSGGSGATGALGSTVAVEPAWRLTNAEYDNTVRDLLGLSPSVPLDPDGATAGFNTGLGAGDAAVRAYYASAIALAEQAAALPELVPCDAAAISATPDTCAASFVDAWVPRAFRRPIEAETRDTLLALHADISAEFGFAAGVRAVVEVVLQSPSFLYHLELEEQALGAGEVAVTGYSMASRLSYLLWASMPDEELFARADAGELSTSEQIQVQVSRMLGDAKAQAGLRNFYEQWLHLNTLPPSKAGGYAEVYDAAMQQSLRDSFNAQVDASLWAESGGLTALFSASEAFVDERTAPLFGLSGVTGNELQLLPVDAAQRAGILTHPALLATLATETGSHPIKRGVFVWDQVLCQALLDPPIGVPDFPGVAPDASVRESFEAFTSPASCMQCHSRINPVGFLFENYDTLGVYRTIDDNGQPVDANVTVAGASNPDGSPDEILNVPMSSATQFATALASDGVASHCLVTQLYRYTTRRLETEADRPVLSALTAAFSDGGQNLTGLLQGLTNTEAFLERRNEQ